MADIADRLTSMNDAAGTNYNTDYDKDRKKQSMVTVIHND